MTDALDRHGNSGGNGSLTWIAVAIFLLLFGATLAWSAYDDYASTLTQEYRTLESQARLGDVHIAGALRGMNLVLQSVIDDAQATPRLPPQVIEQRQLSLLRQFPEIHYLITVDSHGRVTTAEGLDDPGGLAAVRSFDASQRDYYTIHRDAKPEDYYRYQLSRPFKTITNRHTITVSKAIRGKSGQFHGVAVVSLSPTYFDSVLKQVLSNDVLDAAAVHNRFGDIIYRLPNPDKYVGKNIAEGPAFKLYLRSDQHLTRYLGVTATDNVNRILVFSKVGDTSLDIGVSGQFDVVMARWRSGVVMKILIFVTVAGLSLTLAREIQRRLLARYAREKAEQRFRAYFERSMVGMATTSPTHDWIDFNPALCEMLGYSAEELSRKTWAELTYPADLDADIEQFNRLLAGEINEYEIDQRLLRNNGELVYTHLAVRAVRKPDRTLDYVVALVDDISERKEAEAEILRSNAELEQFSYAISHDMRQPLRMISSYLQLLEHDIAGKLDGEQREYFNFAIDGAKRMDSMMVGLLEFSRIGRRGEPAVWMESRAVLEEAMLFLQPMIDEAQADVRIEGEWPRILVSRDEILRLMQNLIGNAIKFRVPGRRPEIIVTSDKTDREWRFSVADNGIGILPDQIGRLFQVFQRLHSRTAYQGNGIGLALSRKIAEHHQGRIWAESAGEGQGSRFCVALPQDETESR